MYQGSSRQRWPCFAEELLYRDPQTQRPCRHRDEIPFFKHQQRTILGMSQKIDPTRIYDYLMHDGYLALGQGAFLGKPGVGPAGSQRVGAPRPRWGRFPHRREMEMLARQPGRRGKIVVCNADEGDPGAYMDRSVLEGNPHSIIEGMLIGAYATGATEGIVYVRAEYPLAIENLSIALDQARELGLLGTNFWALDSHSTSTWCAAAAPSCAARKRR